jgi:hypothetical protein
VCAEFARRVGVGQRACARHPPPWCGTPSRPTSPLPASPQRTGNNVKMFFEKSLKTVAGIVLFVPNSLKPLVPDRKHVGAIHLASEGDGAGRHFGPRRPFRHSPSQLQRYLHPPTTLNSPTKHESGRQPARQQCHVIRVYSVGCRV